MPPAPPPSPAASKRRTWIAVGILVVVAAVAAVHLTRNKGGGGEYPAHNVVEMDGLRYEFNAVTGEERLFELRAGAAPADVTGTRPADVERLRGEMLRRVGADDLETLRAAHEAETEWLKKLGYL